MQLVHCWLRSSCVPWLNVPAGHGCWVANWVPFGQ
jgi:hypothetical protein